ncbi:uncharacterized protein BJ212DRAFT_1301697 [Suillus subaureus]|uniref:Uncharacterized protein n=1 Tax=Suillus subaureus TaxID=48587 RepID=A0A9P7E637_9AGAM|nr:uncharacterized protein BJ212DRAFT_1301697 [Suillus subaureus]KAG1812189.1 hypothetical protein BJ212DRAFT_1301697 [Suillus subaureus]
MPELGVVNEQEFDTMDRAIYEAGWHGLAPLINNHNYYHGGNYTFLRCAGFDITRYDPTNPEVVQFYTNQIIIDFTASHTPRIPRSLLMRPSYVKELAPTKLVIDSTYSINAMHLSIPTIDIFSDHFYPPDIAELQSDISVDQSVNNAYIAGE